jgi:acetoin utilization deacetylase AcuC-like enzyme
MNRRLFLKFAGHTLLISLPLSGFVNQDSLYAQLNSPSSKISTDSQTLSGLSYTEFFKYHNTGKGHPESAHRYDAIMNALGASQLIDGSIQIDPVEADDDTLLYCHSKEYLEIVKNDVENGKSQLSTGDTNISKDSLKVARLAVGAVVAAVDTVITGSIKNAFCVVRPPGHHASNSRGMGFCIFNNVAVGARYAQIKYGLSRILIVDWDVHHGNGTQEIFYNDGSVFFFSTHQFPWYPGTGRADETGAGAGQGTTLNCPLSAGSGRKQVLGAFVEKLLPAMKRFKPEAVFISSGFDSRIDDPLGRFTLTDRDFIDLTKIVLDIANIYAGGRVISVLEGGYNLMGLSKAVTAHVDTMQSA